jgi:hypothetical protein
MTLEASLHRPSARTVAALTGLLIGSASGEWAGASAKMHAGEASGTSAVRAQPIPSPDNDVTDGTTRAKQAGGLRIRMGNNTPPRLCRELFGMHKEPYFDAIALAPAIVPRQCHRDVGHVSATFCPIDQLNLAAFCLGVRGDTSAMRFRLAT